MHKSIDVPRITLPTNITPDSPQDLIEALTIVRESDNITKETTLETLKDMGITAEEIAAHLGMSTEDLLSEDFDFPLDVHPCTSSLQSARFTPSALAPVSIPPAWAVEPIPSAVRSP